MKLGKQLDVFKAGDRALKQEIRLIQKCDAWGILIPYNGTHGAVLAMNDSEATLSCE